ncbi:hypothetical protein F935_00316 [Acinetobacter calcoaceticus ANC 3811]|uniref:Uncharacterized protein n=1 Tax=Acinetobacter calcoaceticus ANC 3811 TaxID=1217690 RepID=R8Y6B3_ACICA|nr:hypothetical protein [Acinetobacter calcoaceticus]EOQ64666.1 hypothetical protein F935_00316 [Acinetobacter calcoaceticus ANC 3811]
MKINNEFIEDVLQYNISEDEIRILEDFCGHESLDNIIHELNLKLPNKKVDSLLISWIISTLISPVNEDKIKKVLNIFYKIKQEDILKKLEPYHFKIHPQNITLIEDIFKNSMTDRQYTFRLQNNLKNINNFIEMGAWEKVYSSLHLAHTELKYYINFSSIHAFYMLTQLKDKSQLYKLILGVRDIPYLWGFFANLPPSLVLDLTYDSHDHHVIFCVLSALFPFEHLNSISLTDSEEQLIASLLYKPEYEKSFLMEILKIFNTYPIRYPTLQRSLGKALGDSNDETYINLYINSLSLTPIPSNDKGREHIQLCLEEFEKLAADELKIGLYKTAFRFWSEWAFNIPQDGYLFDIKFSLLDFAIIKYYKNTFSDKEINILIEQKIEELSDMDNNWYKNSSEFTTQWYWYLSTLQPLFHLQMLNSDTELNYLQVNKEYQFENLDRFISIRIRS